MQNHGPLKYPKTTRTLIWITILATVFLLFMGGLVHNTGHSLACPDWPLCFGQVMPPMEGGILIEHGHRTIATLVGFLVILIFFFLSRRTKKFSQSHKHFTLWGFILLTMVIIQGILGGITVIFRLPTLVSTFHLTLSLLFFSFLIYIEHHVFSHEEYEKLGKIQCNKTAFFPYSHEIALLTQFILIQIIFGAFIRHSGLGAACGLGPDSAFLCRESVNNEWIHTLWPQVYSAQWNMGHRIVGILVFIASLLVSHRAYWGLKKQPLNLNLKSLHILPPLILLSVLIQIALGSTLIYFNLGVVSTTLHLLVAVSLLSFSFKLFLIHRSIEEGIDQLIPRNTLADYWDLTKPKLTLLVIVTTLVGVMIGPRPLGPFPFFPFFAALIGVWGLVAGSCALNCVIEKNVDKKMDRTKNRPLPSGRMPVINALIFGVTLITFGIVLLYFFTSILTLTLGLIAVVFYLFLYTPLKQKGPYAVFIGAIPGAIPPLLGLSALSGSLDIMGLFLFLVLFIWQIPHFLSLSLFYQDDYRKADIKIYPSTTGVRATKFQITFYSFLLLCLSFIPNTINQSNPIYKGTSVALGLLLLSMALKGHVSSEENTKQWARNYFWVTIIYLPILLGPLILFRI